VSQEVPWLRILAIAQIALLIKRHLDRLDGHEKAELRRLVTKSKARPKKNLSRGERERLKELVDKLEPFEFGRAAARTAIRGRPKRP
jgi:hypothetical protein